MAEREKIYLVIFTWNTSIGNSKNLCTVLGYNDTDNAIQRVGKSLIIFYAFLI